MSDPTQAIAPRATPRPPLERIERFQSLEAGTYWRAVAAVPVPNPHWPEHPDTIAAGTVLLVLSLEYFEGTPHTIVLRHHPLDPYPEDVYKLLVDAFLDAFEFAPDGEEVRAREMAAVQQEVADLQAALLDAQTTPALLAPVVQEAIAGWEADRTRRAQIAAHRQARLVPQAPAPAPSSPPAPVQALALPGGRLETNVAATLARRPDDAQIQAMQAYAEREAAIAKATAGWITAKTEAITETLKALSPFFAEKSAAALAKTEAVQRYATELMQGIQSLHLYTGKGVEVETLATGTPAPADAPLALLQRKLFMDEELAAWADVSAGFDFESVEQFDRLLAATPSLRDQILPTPRCVVSMAVRRQDLEYTGRSVYERVLHNEINKRVFLLVRNGENLHRVTSCEPSHEHAARLFPRTRELDQPFTDGIAAAFRGLDASQITFADIRFTEAVAQAQDLALHYTRLLILLWGLDQRLQLFGAFYDPREARQFVTLGFQARHFQFIADDEPHTALGEGRPPVREWIVAQNALLRSGSRTLCYFPALLTPGTAPACQKEVYPNRFVTTYAAPAETSATLIAYKDGPELCVRVPVKRTSWRPLQVPTFLARVRLTQAGDPPADSRAAKDGFGYLCLDAVKAADLEAYVHDREARIAHATFVRLFKQAAAALRAEEAAQAPTRAYLRQALLDAQVVPAPRVDAVLDAAIQTWRCAQRGAPLPGLESKAALTPLLDQLFARERQTDAIQTRIAAYCAEHHRTPLRLALTGRNRVALYAETPRAEQQSLVLPWRWVDRLAFQVRQTGLEATGFRRVWLCDQPDPSETVLQTWPAEAAWVNPDPEPCRPRVLERLTALVTHSVQQGLAVFRQPGRGLPDPVLALLLAALGRLLADRKQFVPSVSLVLPIGVAVLRGPRHPGVGCVVLYENAARWLHTFAAPAQHASIQHTVLRVYAHPEPAAERMRQALHPRVGLLRKVPAGEGPFFLIPDGGHAEPLASSERGQGHDRDRTLARWVRGIQQGRHGELPGFVYLHPALWDGQRARTAAVFPNRPARPRKPGARTP